MAFSSRIGNYLLYTPFDTKASVDKKISSILSKTEFLNHCYVEPRFKKDIWSIIQDNNTDTYDSVIKIDQLKEELRKQKNDRISFFNWLDDITNPKVYTISGNAGTGKTTYIHHLKHERTDKKWIILDVNKASDCIDWFGDFHTDINDFDHNAYYKIFSIITKEISNLFFDFYDDFRCPDLKQICDNLKKIIEYYNQNILKAYPRGMTFFKDLVNILSSHIEEFDIVTSLAEFLCDYFNKVLSNNKNTPMQTWCVALDILLIVLRCANNDKKCYVIVFDNLERFIAHNEIYNDEIDEIRRKLASYNKALCEYNHCHYGKFKFIMAMRNNSARMCGVKLHSADERPSDLNLSEWFIVNDIIAEKKKWYKEHHFEDDNIQILELITGDLRRCKDGELTGLQLQIDPLFNNNKRLIIDFIGQILERDSNVDFIDKYKDLWEKNTHISRFAARSIIRGLILKELNDNDNLFIQLRLYSEGKTEVFNGLGYTRNILTILFNNRDEDVTLSEILSLMCSNNNIYDYWNNHISEKSRKDIATILYYMNSYNRRDNDWIQFLDMQIEDSKHSIYIDSPTKLENMIRNNMNNFKLRIMPAGEAYLKYIVASFEYFSFRYYKNNIAFYKPLFATIPTIEDIKNCGKKIQELECCKIMCYVRDRALKCIELMKKDIRIRLKINKAPFGKYHHIRIIEQHQNYIDNFIECAKEFLGESNSVDLINECKNIRDSYNTHK